MRQNAKVYISILICITWIVLEEESCNEFTRKNECHPPADRQQTASRVQRGHVEAASASVTIPLEPVDISRATVSISGPVKAYTLSAEALAVTLTEPGYINWEVRE